MANTGIILFLCSVIFKPSKTGAPNRHQPDSQDLPVSIPRPRLQWVGTYITSNHKLEKKKKSQPDKYTSFSW